jgi:hypothetical protein
MACCNEGDSSDEELDVIEFTGAPPKPPAFELLKHEDPDLQVALIRNFLTPDEVAKVHEAAGQDDVKEIDDRDPDLIYKHHVWRFENQLKDMHRHIYDKVTQVAWSFSGALWNSVEDGEELFPEIEYIVYDVKDLGEAGTIHPHTDNQSAVSMVILLSPPQDFVGGVNYFEGEGESSDEEEKKKSTKVPREARLRTGDAVFFYGDKCEHWITPVLSGRRTIMQMELSRSDDSPACATFTEMLTNFSTALGLDWLRHTEKS